MQAHECTLNWDMRESDKEDVECYNILAREAAQVGECHDYVLCIHTKYLESFGVL